MLIIAADLPAVNSLEVTFPEVITAVDGDAEYLAWLDSHAEELAEEAEAYDHYASGCYAY